MLNLINDPWIPVRDKSGGRRVIAPWQIADPDIAAPDWPRADLNVACLELLIGLVFMADPPEDDDDWDDRVAPDPDRLREKLAAYAPAFNLIGDGPLFLQDLEQLDGAPSSVDMLFIDSAGQQTAKNNADLMVHRDRYGALELPMAAMALYAFQAFAPSGGAGNRTSMRGGGPMVTLVDPGEGLWALVWANVPCGEPAHMIELPWLNPTRESKKLGKDHDAPQVMPPQEQTFSVEAFFGVPRRLRLVAEDDLVTGVIQRPYGTNYAMWMHPLCPYYRVKAGTEALPAHPKAGSFGYRHWLGVLAKANDDNLAMQAACVETWNERRAIDDFGKQKSADVIVAGWAMDNMKPRDFAFSRQPLIDVLEECRLTLSAMIIAADKASVALRAALEPILSKGEAREAERELFYINSEPDFLSCVSDLQNGVAAQAVRTKWFDILKTTIFARFDALALPVMDQRNMSDIEKITTARRNLGAAFGGYSKLGKEIFQALSFEIPAPKKKGKTT